LEILKERALSFKQNILKKIEINRLARQVTDSLIPRGDVHKIDKAGMRKLLDIAGFSRIKERDLELYALTEDADPNRILVLDNGLAVYHTTVKDVAMRKSPTVKEMVSIRNIIKILKDDDVVISKKEKTVEFVREASIDALDLSFTREDLDRIRLDGAASLESDYPDGVIESMEIFAELLGYSPPPKAFALRHCRIAGALTHKSGGDTVYGPAVIFNRIHHTLKLIDTPIKRSDKEKMAYYHRVADGAEKAPLEGVEVFTYLMEAAL